MTKKFKLTIEVEATERSSGTHAVVGVFLSEAWWRVFNYWIGNRLRSEGLVITKFTTEELTE